MFLPLYYAFGWFITALLIMLVLVFMCRLPFRMHLQPVCQQQVCFSNRCGIQRDYHSAGIPRH